MSMLLALTASGALLLSSFSAGAAPAESYFYPWMYDVTMTTDVLQEKDHNLEREWLASTMVDENFKERRAAKK